MFGILKTRFSILHNRTSFLYQTQVKVVIVCRILHNYIRRYDDKDEVQALEEERLLGNVDEEDDSY